MLLELYSIIQYFVITYNGIESEKYYIYIYMHCIYMYKHIYIYTHTYIHTHIINQLYFNLRKEKRVDRM